MTRRLPASAAAVARILERGEPVYGVNTGFGKLAGVRIADADLAELQRNIVLSHAAGVGAPSPVAVIRLMMALKLASLAQGASGVRLATLRLLEAMLDRGVTPIVPAQGLGRRLRRSRAARSYGGEMIGVGEARYRDRIVPAADALARRRPRADRARRRRKGWRCSMVRNSPPPMRSPACSRRKRCCAPPWSLARCRPTRRAAPTRRSTRASMPCAAIAARSTSPTALRALMAGSAIRASHVRDDERVQDPYCLRCQPQVMGAASICCARRRATLEDEANGVSDNPLIFAETDEALSGGNFHAEPVAFAADMIALAICEIGSLAERRVAMLVDPALSGLPAFLTPKPGLNSGFMIPQVTAAALVSENKQRAYPASVDSIPTSANQEDHVSMAAHGARRLTPMVENAAAVVGIELIAAAQACDFHAPLLPARRSRPARRGCEAMSPGSTTTAICIPTSPRRRRSRPARSSPRRRRALPALDGAAR